MAYFKIAEDPVESMGIPSPSTKSPARSRRRLSKGSMEKENADPKSPQSILKKGEQRRALGDLHIFDVRSPARIEMVNGQSIEASPVFNKKKKPKRSLSRRVSFAEKPAVRIFVKDTEYETPPDAKAHKTGLFVGGASLQARTDSTKNPIPQMQPPASRPDSVFDFSTIEDDGLHFEMQPAGHTGPISFKRSTEPSLEQTDPFNGGASLEGAETQQCTPVMQQQVPAGRFNGTPNGTPGGSESSPEFFSPRNYVSPLSSDDGMELTHTPNVDFELLPPQEEPFGSAISNRRRSSLGGNGRPSFGGFGASPFQTSPGALTDMTGSITAMVPKLAKVLAEQQDFTFSTGPLPPECKYDVEGTPQVSPVPSDMSMTPVLGGRPSDETGRLPSAEKVATLPVPKEGGREEDSRAGRRFEDLLELEGGAKEDVELSDVFEKVRGDDDGVGEDRRGSITCAVPGLQDLLANDLDDHEEATEGIRIWAAGERRGSIMGAIPNLQALLDADQDLDGNERAADWTADGKEDDLQPGSEEDSPGEGFFNFDTPDDEHNVGSPDGGETTQLLSFKALVKSMGVDADAADDLRVDNVTDMVPRLADLVEADGAETQLEDVPVHGLPDTQGGGEGLGGEVQAPPNTAPRVGNSALPLLFTGDEQEEVFGLRSWLNAGMRPQGRASLQPMGVGGPRAQHRRASVRGRASVGGGWAAMLSAEAQEGGQAERWWVKDKPESEQDDKQHQMSEGGSRRDGEGSKPESFITNDKAPEGACPDSTTTEPSPEVPASAVETLPPSVPHNPPTASAPPEVLTNDPAEQKSVGKKRPREEALSGSQPVAGGIQADVSPQPAVKKQRRLQALTPVTEQTSAAEREESQGAMFGWKDDSGEQEVTQVQGAPPVVTFPTEQLESGDVEEEIRVALQGDVPTQHSGIFGSGGKCETEEAPCELEYKMLKLENKHGTPTRSPSPNSLPTASRLQLRKSALKMQTALRAAANDTDTAGQPDQERMQQAGPVPEETIPPPASEAVVEPPPQLTAASAGVPPADVVTEPVPAEIGDLPQKADPPGDFETAAEAPPADSMAVQVGTEGPVEPPEDVTETTFPLAPPRLQGLRHLRRESLGVLPPTEGSVGQALLPPAVKVFTPGHTAFTPRGKENFTPHIGVSSVRKFRTPAPDRPATDTGPLPSRAVQSDDMTAELACEEEHTGKLAGRISFAEFLYKAEVRFLDARNRASMFAQQTPTGDVSPPEGLADSLKLVLFNQPLTTVLGFGCEELRESIAAKKASVAQFEMKLQESCPAIFHAVHTASGPARAALLKKLKDLKQRCRLEARRQLLEWRLRLEENASERLQENERNLLEDLEAVQQKRQQLHELHQDVRDFQERIDADVRRNESEIVAAQEREAETRSMNVRLEEETRRQQQELEQREAAAQEAQLVQDSMVAQREAASLEQLQLTERLQAVESKCGAARVALLSSGAAGDDGMGGGRVAIDEGGLEQLRQRGDSKKGDLRKELQAIARTQGWVLTKSEWHSPRTPSGEGMSLQEHPASALTSAHPGDALQREGGGGVLELRHHDGLFTQIVFSSGKEETVLESLLEVDAAALDEAYPLIDSASSFAAAMLAPIGIRVPNNEGLPMGSLVQNVSLRIGRVFDLLNELADCRRDYPTLSSIAFTATEGEAAGALHLRFTDHSQSIMFTVAFAVAHSDGAPYPFGKLPSTVTVQYAGRAGDRDTLATAVSKSVCDTQPGFGKMERTCRNVSELLRSSRSSEEQSKGGSEM